MTLSGKYVDSHHQNCSNSICNSFSDYGYMRSDSFTGPCVRDNSVSLPPTNCSEGQASYYQTQGYRKVAGDVCENGVQDNLSPVLHPCCSGGGKHVWVLAQSRYDVSAYVDPCNSRCAAGISTCQLTPTSGYACVCVPGYEQATPSSPCVGTCFKFLFPHHYLCVCVVLQM